ncbi:hypothetical protein TcWFU_007597 [Taenia crassiceps]|uniref:Uncharacterized protein n=1 Tax=Taenia crassiceps TaxID=6207 RepID=A0ABR4Q2H1_9CEST
MKTGMAGEQTLCTVMHAMYHRPAANHTAALPTQPPLIFIRRDEDVWVGKDVLVVPIPRNAVETVRLPIGIYLYAGRAAPQEE